MRIIGFAVLAALFALPASFANAGVMGTTTLSVSNFYIRTADDPDGGLGDITADSSGSATTSLNGSTPTVENFNFMTNASPYTEGVVGQGVSGSIVVGGSFDALVAPGIDVTSIASAELTTPGSGFSSSAASLSVPFSPTNDISVTISFDGLASVVETMSDPLGSFTGFTEFSITLIAAGLGTGDTNLLDQLNTDAAALNQSGLGTSGLVSVSQTIELFAGATYTFGINQFSRADVNLREQVIPEPTSAVCFSALLIVGFCSRRKRA